MIRNAELAHPGTGAATLGRRPARLAAQVCARASARRARTRSASPGSLRSRRRSVAGKSGLASVVAYDALRQPGFALLWISTSVNFSAFFLRSTIQGWLVLQLTNSSTWVGLVNALPVIVTAPLSFIAGAIADRGDARRLLIWTRAASASTCFLTAFLITAGVIDVYQMLFLATILTAAFYLGFPANQTYILALVGGERLLAANSLVTAFGFGFNFIGPSLAGYAAAELGIDSVYYALGLAYLVAMLTLLQTPPAPASDARPAANMLRDVFAGIAYVRTQTGLAWVYYVALLGISGSPFLAILPAMARDELGLGAAGFGLIAGSQGVGSLVASTVMLARGQVQRKGVAMVAGAVIWAMGMILIGSAQEAWQAIAAGALMGFSPPLWMNSAQTVIMTAVPAAMRARMAALFALSFQMVPLGYLLGGVLADALGPGPALQLLGAAGILLHLPPLLSRQFRNIG